MSASKYPMTLHHPAFVKGTTTKVPVLDANGAPAMRNGMPDFNYRGTSDRFPPVDVQNEDQEFQYRAKGYGSANDVATAPTYLEYPVWLKNDDGAEVMAKDAHEEAELLNDGYQRKGKSDPEAVERSLANPYDPEFEADEWPKMVDGKLVQDPNKSDGALHYPMWVGDSIVKNEAEERAARGGAIFRDGKLIAGEVEPAVPVKPADPRRDALVTLAGIKGVPVTDDMDADAIEAALFQPDVRPLETAQDTRDRAGLFAQADAAGVKIDRRWSNDKIRAALADKAA